MTAAELFDFNTKLNRIKELREHLEAQYEGSVLDENWTNAATFYNRLNQLQHLENKLRFAIK